MSSLATKMEDLGEGLLIMAIVVGGIAVPIFLNVSTTGMSATQLLAWGAVLTIGLAAGALAFIRHMRKGK